MDGSGIDRRRVLAMTAAGFGALAGCLTDSDPDVEPSQTDSPTPEVLTQPETTSTARRTQSEAETPAPTQIKSFVKVEGATLAIEDGPVHFFGTRPQNVMDLSHPAEWIEENLDMMEREGYTLARVHAFQPFWGTSRSSPNRAKLPMKSCSGWTV